MKFVKGGSIMTLTKANIIETVSAENCWTAKQVAEYIEICFKFALLIIGYICNLRFGIFFCFFLVGGIVLCYL